MQPDSRLPLAIRFCNWIVSAASMLVPAASRADWKQEWKAEVWHRWRFFVDVGEWNSREAFFLLRSTAGSFADAAWCLASEEKVRHRISEVARSPWTCLGTLALLLVGLAVFSGGLPATRNLFHPVARRNATRLAIISLQSQTGRRELGLHADILKPWQKESKLLLELAPFRFEKRNIALPGQAAQLIETVETDARLFQILGVIPEQGSADPLGIVLSHTAWEKFFKPSKTGIGSIVQINGRPKRISGILPSNFSFLSRQPAIYLMSHQMNVGRVMIAASVKPGVGERQLEKELNEIAQDPDAYWYSSRLRFTFLEYTLLTPAALFAVTALLTGLVVIVLCHVRLRGVRVEGRTSGFFMGKVAMALILVFVGFLEWSRPATSMLLGWMDAASGPAVMWLYVAGSMAVWVWAVADQRARCRVCLRLLCFPVRVGCPGCLLLDWAGTELLCTQGHGMLHVPDMATSWETESDRWIALDESWRGLFARSE